MMKFILFSLLPISANAGAMINGNQINPASFITVSSITASSATIGGNKFGGNFVSTGDVTGVKIHGDGSLLTGIAVLASTQTVTGTYTFLNKISGTATSADALTFSVSSCAAGQYTHAFYNNGGMACGTPAGAGDVLKAATQTFTGANTFTSDTYFPGSGIWNTSGNVGIGMTNPSVGKFQVKNTAGVGQVILDDFQISPDTPTLAIKVTSAGSELKTYGGSYGGYMNLSLNASGGKVGIGTTNPTTTFEVVGNSRFSSVTSTADFSAGWIDIGLVAVSSAPATAMTSATATCAAGYTMIGYRAFYCNNGATSPLYVSGSANNGAVYCPTSTTNNVVTILCAKVK